MFHVPFSCLLFHFCWVGKRSRLDFISVRLMYDKSRKYLSTHIDLLMDMSVEGSTPCNVSRDVCSASIVGTTPTYYIYRIIKLNYTTPHALVWRLLRKADCISFKCQYFGIKRLGTVFQKYYITQNTISYPYPVIINNSPHEKSQKLVKILKRIKLW